MTCTIKVLSTESWCRKKDAKIDWSKPVQEVYNLIRGTNPQPGAWTIFNGNEVQIFDSQMIDASGKPGEIMSTSNDGIVIAAGGGSILVQRLRPQDSGKITAQEFIETSGISAGASFDI